MSRPLIPLGEKFLRHTIREYLEHYHAERHHQGKDIGNRLLFPDDRASPERTGKVVMSSRLGGLLKFYHRDASALRSDIHMSKITLSNR